MGTANEEYKDVTQEITSPYFSKELFSLLSFSLSPVDPPSGLRMILLLSFPRVFVAETIEFCAKKSSCFFSLSFFSLCERRRLLYRVTIYTTEKEFFQVALKIFGLPVHIPSQGKSPRSTFCCPFYFLRNIGKRKKSIVIKLTKRNSQLSSTLMSFEANFTIHEYLKISGGKKKCNFSVQPRERSNEDVAIRHRLENRKEAFLVGGK